MSTWQERIDNFAKTHSQLEPEKLSIRSKEPQAPFRGSEVS